MFTVHHRSIIKSLFAPSPSRGRIIEAGVKIIRAWENETTLPHPPPPRPPRLLPQSIGLGFHLFNARKYELRAFIHRFQWRFQLRSFLYGTLKALHRAGLRGYRSQPTRGGGGFRWKVWKSIPTAKFSGRFPKRLCVFIIFFKTVLSPCQAIYTIVWLIMSWKIFTSGIIHLSERMEILWRLRADFGL